MHPRPAAVLAGVLLCGACSLAAEPSPSTTSSMFDAAPAAAPTSADSVEAAPAPTASTADAANEPNSVGALAAALGWIEISAEHREGYDRGQWAHWNAGVLDDGLNTRHEVLADQSLCAVRIAADAVREGCWVSLYDAVNVSGPGDVDIDHVVALVEAHDSGGWAWDPQRREAFANWHGGLLAVSAESNRAKSGADPTRWLPSDPTMVCPYLLTWTLIKAEWDLTMDPEEHEVISRHVDRCVADVTLFDVLGTTVPR